MVIWESDYEDMKRVAEEDITGYLKKLAVWESDDEDMKK